MINYFEKEKFILAAFINLSKAFDTVSHSILPKKLNFYSITDKNLARFESYLSNRKQYIQIDKNSKTDLNLNMLPVAFTKDLFLDPFYF